MDKLVTEVFKDSLWIDKEFNPPIEGLIHVKTIQDAVNAIERADDISKMRVFVSIRDDIDAVLDIVDFIKNRDSGLLNNTYIVYNGDKHVHNMFLLPCACSKCAEM